MTPTEFIDWLAPVAQRICRRYRLYASVCIAQAAMENGWGRYTIGDYNIFGRKAAAGDKIQRKSHQKCGFFLCLFDKSQFTNKGDNK